MNGPFCGSAIALSLMYFQAHGQLSTKAFDDLCQSQPASRPSHITSPFAENIEALRPHFPGQKDLPGRDAQGPFRFVSPFDFQVTSSSFVIDTAVVRSIQDTMRYVSDFNETGRIVSTVKERLSGESWPAFERETYIYDAHNNILAWTTAQYAQEGWAVTARDDYRYEIDGATSTVFVEHREKGELIRSGHISTTTVESGKVIESVFDKWSSGTSVQGDRYTWTYDKSGRMLSQVHESLIDQQSIYLMRTTYNFDGSGNSTFLTEQLLEGEWVNVFLDTNTNRGDTVLNISQRWSNGQWADFWRNTVVVDRNVSTSISEFWGDGHSISISRETRSYGAGGRPSSVLMEEWSTDRWVTVQMVEYTFDAVGRLESYRYENWINGVSSGIRKETFGYDAFGNITSFSFARFINSTWVDEEIDGGIRLGDGQKYYTFSECYNVTLSYKQIVTGIARVSLPEQSVLGQNYPNPFNPTTTIEYTIAGVSGQSTATSVVRLVVYDVLGREVRTLVNEPKPPGTYRVLFDGEGLPSGAYFYRLQAGGVTKTKRLLLLK